MHEPLSQRLAQILEVNSSPGQLTINSLIESTESRGLYLIVLLLSLPFIVPVSIPGVSTVLGLVIAVLCFRFAFGWSPRLPRFLGARPLPPILQKKILTGSVKVLRFIEKLARPRRTRWLATRPARCANALLMTLMGLLLALPFPPLPPFTNSLPCYSLILVAASAMEEDGLLIWCGYAVSLVTIVYLILIAAVLEHAFVRIYHALVHFSQ